VRTVVIDTNVLLSQPEVVNGFQDADVVIPETVLSEIDKLKTARVDPDLRYKGRQISRILFDLSERGSLHEGVGLPGGGDLRIVGLTDEKNLPEGLSGRNADDRILAVALQERSAGSEVTLVTNDLNMLLKAQTFGLDVERVETDEGFARRFLMRPFQRYRGVLTVLGISLAVFAAAIYLAVFSPYAPSRQATGISALPPEFVEQLSVDQQQVLNYLFRLEGDPKDLEAQKAVAILYDSMSQQNTAFIPYAIQHWEKVVELTPNDTAARTDLATLYFRSGSIDRAIAAVSTVLRQDPNHVNANFNLGIFYMNTKPKQYQKAANQFVKVVKVARDNPEQAGAAQRAQTMLDQIKKEAATAGQPITDDGGTL
jgi:hypothetical protein